MVNFGKTPWWIIEDSDEATQQMSNWIRNLDIWQSGKSWDLFQYASVYANRDMLSMARSAADPYVSTMPNQIINRIKANIDTLVGRQIQDESRAVFNVSDGDFDVAEKARKNERFVEGEMYRLRAYELCRMALRDAAWAGDGWIRARIKNKKVYLERPLPMEMIIDEAANLNGGEPSELYCRSYIPRHRAVEMFPDYEEQINLLPNVAPPYFWPSTDADMVMLHEGWHLGYEDEDGARAEGRYLCGIDTICIKDEPYTRNRFPFARIRWSSATIGSQSQGLVEECLNLQSELDLVTRRIQTSVRLFSTPRVWQQAGTKISAEYNNMIGNVYKYAGMKPEVDPGTPPPPGLYEREGMLIDLIDAQAGVSKMELTGDVPSHTDSRPALREVQEIAAGRRDWISKKFQELCARDLAELIIDTARDIVKKYKSYRANGRAKSFIESIDFKDINLEDDRFQVAVQPASLLPNTVAGKRMVAGDLMEKGLIQDPSDIWDMLSGMPDVDQMRRLKTASKRLTERQLCAIKEQKQYIPPVETQDVMYALKMAQDELNYLYTLDNVPEDVIKNMNRFVFECNVIKELLTPPPPPPAPAPPLGVPGAPPVPGATALGAPQLSPVPNGAPVPVPPAPVQ